MSTKNKLFYGAAVLIAMAGVTGAANATTVKKHVKKAAPEASQTTAQIQALTEEVTALKAELDQEVAQRQQAQSQVQAAQAQADQAQASVAATQSHVDDEIKRIPGEVKEDVAAVAPKTDKLYYKGVSITFGGFAEAAGIYRSRDETADIASSYTKMPFPQTPAAHTGETDFTGRQSRYSALIQGNVSEDTVASFYGEFDFLGAAQTANSNQSNSYNPRVRNLYAAMDWNNSGWHLLAGQNWSLVTMNSKGITPRNEVTPPQIDAQYIPGFAWARQPQIRLTKNFGQKIWLAVSLENPQTTIGGSASAISGISVTDTQAPTANFYSGTNYSLNSTPDVVTKVAYEDTFGGHSFHAEALGLLREFEDRVDVTATNALSVPISNTVQRTTGGGIGGSVALSVVPKVLDFQASVLGGDGIGRYGSAGLSDTTVRPNGKLGALPETMWLTGGTFHATPMLDVYLFGGAETDRSKVYNVGNTLYGYGADVTGVSNAGCNIENSALACSGFNKSVNQVTAGLWQKIYNGPAGRVQFGLQYSHTTRELFADPAGNAPKASEDMVFTSFRYYPF
jgi:hypothetical protein